MPEISLEDLIAKAVNAYNSLSPEERKAHDRAQAISWVHGNLALSGRVYTQDEIARIYDEYQKEKA